LEGISDITMLRKDQKRDDLVRTVRISVIFGKNKEIVPSVEKGKKRRKTSLGALRFSVTTVLFYRKLRRRAGGLPSRRGLREKMLKGKKKNWTSHRRRE